MVKENSEIIQAFPINANTFIGTPTSLSAVGYSILHAAENCDITFNFSTGAVTVSVVAGQDLAFGEGVVDITATATCWVS